uniref:ATP-dependent DNA helicase n=1 Tax=Chenopodium quinoa TaxID=63459 RepID=A0A803LHZ9_CHEQI
MCTTLVMKFIIELTHDLDPEIVDGLSKMLSENNQLAKVFKMARERLSNVEMHLVSVRLIGTHSKDGRQYNLLSRNELATLIVGNGESEGGQQDVIVEEKRRGLRRISENHPSFMALQYPLLFPYGEDGFRIDIPHRDAESTTRDTSPASIGQRVFLPSSFTTGPRYMVENYHDAMAICRWAGPPDLFITFTCNPKWQEITEFLADILGQGSEGRPDVVVRVFKLKLDELIRDLTTREHFGQTIEDHEHLDAVLERVGQKKTTLTEWMTANKLYAEAHDLTYVDFPTEWRWLSDERKEQKTKIGTSIGRIYFAHPAFGEKYYLRLLLNIVKGATCFEDIKTVGGIIHPTYKAACHALGLLIGDNEWHECLHEAVIWATSTQLRNLFATILLFCEVSDPKYLWEKHWEALSDDTTHRQRQRLGIANLSLTKEQLQNYALYEIEKLLNIENRSLIDYHGIPLPDATLLQDSGNRMVLEEQNYDTQSLARNACDLENGLNAEQRNVYDNILEAVYHNTGKLSFVYGSGGSGKTYLWKALISKLRSEEHIVLAVASLGISALLLPLGRTAHSRFKIPMNLNENSCCSIEQGSDLAELIHKTKLIIWDEAPMVHRYAFEAVDRTLRDIMQLYSKG